MLKIIKSSTYKGLLESLKNLNSLITMPDDEKELRRRKTMLENMLKDVNDRLQRIHTLNKKIRYAKRN